MVVVRNWMKEVIADTDTDTLTHLCIGCVGGRGVISGRGALCGSETGRSFLGGCTRSRGSPSRLWPGDGRRLCELLPFVLAMAGCEVEDGEEMERIG
ncbi:hypothetical protein M6B38_196545 [Iris pallida]|uniref:Uncharacterized protein n=1 Tax=Iris pallida TaxID=29817 RepID=A0AAX6ED56_IRIPA|nr:hypothetical protein M6B38_196545 [Iris pallida]